MNDDQTKQTTPEEDTLVGYERAQATLNRFQELLNAARAEDKPFNLRVMLMVAHEDGVAEFDLSTTTHNTYPALTAAFWLASLRESPFEHLAPMIRVPGVFECDDPECPVHGAKN